MQKIKYSNKEFDVKSIVSNEYGGIDTITIEFAESTAFGEVQAFYDIEHNGDILRRMEIYGETVTQAEGEETPTYELQGLHIGYTKPVDISCFKGAVKVKIEKELAVESRVAYLQDEVDNLTMAQLESEGIL